MIRDAESTVKELAAQLVKIQVYIEKNFPQDFSAGDLVSDVVIKLLGRYRGEQSISLASEAIFGRVAR